MTDLASPLALGRGTELPNRLAKAALSERIAGPDGAPCDECAHPRVDREARDRRLGREDPERGEPRRAEEQRRIAAERDDLARAVFLGPEGG